MDAEYEQSKVGSLGVVKWSLSPLKILEMGFNEFVKLVSSHRVGVVQERRLMRIWEKAQQWIGCSLLFVQPNVIPTISNPIYRLKGVITGLGHASALVQLLFSWELLSKY